MSAGRGVVVGKVAKWVMAAALVAGCGGSKTTTPPPGGGNVGVDAGPVVNPGPVDAGPVDAGPVDAGPVDAGPVDAGPVPGPDAGPVDAGTPDAGAPDAGPVDAGTPDAGPDGGVITFGTPGPWPTGNVTYGSADGIQESPVVGVTTDEPVTLPGPNAAVVQNLWIATHDALYLKKPGDSSFRRFDARDGLHLPGNVAASCNDSAGLLVPCPNGSADAPGISEIVGGGPNEVFVGYYGHHDWTSPVDGTESDPYRHSGKLERVRLKADGKLEVIRFDMVSNNTIEFWHNRTVERMIYDHFIHKHELYVGTDHGVDKISPDLWHEPVGWFLLPQNQQQWMSDHLHPRACYHAPCVDDSNQRLGDWRALGLDSTGDLWVGGRWAAGAIKYLADNTNWYNNPRSSKPGDEAFKFAFGDPYTSYCMPGYGRPVFCAPQEGDFVNLSAVAVTRDVPKDPALAQDMVWYSSGIIYGDVGDVNYGVAAFLARPGVNQQMWTYFNPISDIGMSEMNVRDMVALPDGRLVLAGPTTGLTVWDPRTPGVRGHQIRAGQGIPSDNVLRLEVDAMVNPPALHVATDAGAAVLRVLQGSGWPPSRCSWGWPAAAAVEAIRSLHPAGSLPDPAAGSHRHPVGNRGAPPDPGAPRTAATARPTASSSSRWWAPPPTRRRTSGWPPTTRSICSSPATRPSGASTRTTACTCRAMRCSTATRTSAIAPARSRAPPPLRASARSKAALPVKSSSATSASTTAPPTGPTPTGTAASSTAFV